MYKHFILNLTIFGKVFFLLMSALMSCMKVPQKLSSKKLFYIIYDMISASFVWRFATRYSICVLCQILQ